MPGPPGSQQPVRKQEEDFDYGGPGMGRGNENWTESGHPGGERTGLPPQPSKHKGQRRAFLACSQAKARGRMQKKLG